MKQMILMMTVLLGFAFNASAAPMAKTILKTNLIYDKAIVKLYNQEAKIKGSPINAYLAALKAEPDNQDYFFDDTIDTQDVVRLDSGAGAGSFEINYLIIIRAGFKSNTFQAGFLKAAVYGAIDEDQVTTLVITEPAKVTIE